MQINNQKGFVTGPLLVGIALIVMIVAFMSNASRSNNTNVSKQDAKASASLVIKQSVELSEAYSRALSDGVSPALASLGPAVGKTDLYDAAHGWADVQTLPAKLFNAGDESEWAIAEVSAGNFGLSLTGLTSDICVAVNRILYSQDTPIAGAKEGCATNSYYRILREA